MSTTNVTNNIKPTAIISDRTKKESKTQVLLNRPYFGAMSGVMLVFIFFILIAGGSDQFGAIL